MPLAASFRYWRRVGGIDISPEGRFVFGVAALAVCCVCIVLYYRVF